MTYYQEMFNKHSKDEAVYNSALRALTNEQIVSTAKLQRLLKINYILARIILDRMIIEGYAEKQVGARPCRIIRQ